MQGLMLGRFENKLDQKSRTFVPAKFRDIIGGEFIMAFYEDIKCIKCMTNEKFVDLCNESDDSEDLKYLRKGLNEEQLIRNSRNATIDNQGRTTIPAQWLESMSVEDTVLIVGMRNYFEIWGAQDYEEYTSKINKETKLAKLTSDSVKKAEALKALAQAKAIIEQYGYLLED